MMETHEYCLIYSKQKEKMIMGVLPVEDEEISDWEIDEKGYWKLGGSLKATGINAPREARPNLFFPVYIDEDTLEWSLEPRAGIEHQYHLIPLTEGNEMSWYWSRQKFESDKDEVIVKKTKDGYSLYKKQRPSLGDMPSKRGKTTFYHPKYATANSNSEIRKLFNGKKIFDYTKSSKLIVDLLNLANTKEQDIILDFFSGSATTAHAVMQLNAEDGGQRKFIMVQLDETTGEQSEAFKAGYRTIPEIGRKRIQLAGDKIAKEYPDVKVDYGFRALKIDSTNEKDIYRTPGQTNQEELFDLVDNIKPERSDLDLLFGVLVQTAFELNQPIEERELAGQKVYVYGYYGEMSGVLACFEEKISQDTVQAIAKLKPLMAVFKESSFAASQDKINLSEQFRILSPDTKIKVI